MTELFIHQKSIKDSEAQHAIKKFGNISEHDLITNVATKKSFQYASGNKNCKKIVAFDFGVKENILKILEEFNAEIIVVPPNTISAEDVCKNETRWDFPLKWSRGSIYTHCSSE